MSVDLTRARLVEFDGSASHGPRFSAIRPKPGLTFSVFAVDGVIQSTYVQWGEIGIREVAKNITVLAEFPLTLADLIPDDCEAFVFKDKKTNERLYATLTNAGEWEVSGYQGRFEDAEQLARFHRVDLTTVVPVVITTHPQYVEERR